MIDGLDELNNILVIGMTNRIDLLDKAMLRPGRMEVLIEIGLPNEAGREQIFRIHTKQMRSEGRLDEALDIKRLAKQTKNFSGAEIEGVVRAATQYALMRNIDLGNLNS